jgi:hypothetical protein
MKVYSVRRDADGRRRARHKATRPDAPRERDRGTLDRQHPAASPRTGC